MPANNYHLGGGGREVPVRDKTLSVSTYFLHEFVYLL